MQVIPAIDVLDGRVVRLRRGSYDDVTVYGDEVVAFARPYVEQGADLVHVVDLGAARDGGDHDRSALCRALSEAGVPFQIGGGIRDADTAIEVVAAGASRVVVGTAAVADPEALEALVTAVGADRMVGAVDVRDGRARGSGWEDEGAPVGEVLRRLADLDVEWVLVTGISRDGTLSGPDLTLMNQVREQWPSFSVIASGGVGDLDDLRSLATAGFEAVVVGKALLEGRFTVTEALEAVGSIETPPTKRHPFP